MADLDPADAPRMDAPELLPPPETVRAVTALGQVFANALRDDPALREGVAALGQWLVRIAGAARTAAEEPDGQAHGASAAAPPASSQPPVVIAVARTRSDGAPQAAPPKSPIVVPLRLGDATAAIPVPHAEGAAALRADPMPAPAHRIDGQGAATAEGAATSSAALPDLDLVARRCRVKAECTRWAIERRRRIAEGEEMRGSIRLRDRELAAQAHELPECYAWQLDPFGTLPADGLLEDVAVAYENLAAVATLTRELSASSDPEAAAFREEVYQLMAEAQSALRSGLAEADQRVDRDQDDAFHWLRRRTELDRVFVRRHMRLDDPADARAGSQLKERIDESAARFHDRLAGWRRRRKAMSKLEYISGQLPRAEDDESRRRHWKALAEAIETLIDSGVIPSDAGLRELLLPVVDEMPGWMAPGPGLARVLAAIDEYLSLLENRVPAQPRERVPTPEVLEVRELLRGGVVVLIGGEPRPGATAALEEAFALSELRWVGTREHQSTAPFEPEVRRAEVALVMLAIRWASHSFERVSDFCHDCGKPFVRLPGGYSPNTVASEILAQARDALTDAARGVDRGRAKAS